MKVNDLKTKSVQELRDMIQSMKAKLQNFGFDLRAGKVKNVREARGLKKDIARVFTMLQSLKK